MRTLISNGTVVSAEGSYAADVLIDGEAVAQIGLNLGEGATLIAIARNAEESDAEAEAAE